MDVERLTISFESFSLSIYLSIYIAFSLSLSLQHLAVTQLSHKRILTAKAGKPMASAGCTVANSFWTSIFHLLLDQADLQRIFLATRRHLMSPQELLLKILSEGALESAALHPGTLSSPSHAVQPAPARVAPAPISIGTADLTLGDDRVQEICRAAGIR